MSEPRERDTEETVAKPDGQRAPRDARPKREDEMSKGKDYPLHTQDAQFEYDPARHRAREEGGEPG